MFTRLQRSSTKRTARKSIPAKGQSILSSTASSSEIPKVPSLALQKEYAERDNSSLIVVASEHILVLWKQQFCRMMLPSSLKNMHGWSSYIPVKDLTEDVPLSCAMLVSLDVTDFNWDVNFSLLLCQQDFGYPTTDAYLVLNDEYKCNGYNASFQTVI